MSSGKQYGLQLPKKSSGGLVQKHNIFGDSDSEKSDEGGTDWKKRALKASEKSTVKKKTQIEMERALEEDTTVYQYDEVYEDMQKGKQEKISKEKDKKPKYIEKLMAAAEKRKIENERRIERQVQKERELEGDEFKDKETFVTSAYKKKLEEFAKLDAEQRRQDMLEEISDVTKQQDMSGFYRHLYQTKMEGEKAESPSKPIKKEEPESPAKESKTTSRRSVPKDSSLVKGVKTEPDSSIKKVDPKKDARKYRKRKDSESSQEKNQDADTDVGSSSSSSSSSSDSESGEDDKSSQSETENPKRLLSKRHSGDQPAPVEEVTESEPVAVEKPPPQPEINIWEKRTVGPVFDAALKRYYERKAARLAAAS